MDKTFFTFFEKLESFAFFAGFPIIFSLVAFLSESKKSKSLRVTTILMKSLPLAYALSGTLFLGMQIRNLYPDFSMEQISLFFNGHWSRVWALTVLLFWIPLFRKKPVWSLLHSMIFFLLLAKDFFTANNDVIRNNMKVYTDSLILNGVTFLIVFMIYQLYFFFQTSRKSQSN